MKRLYLAQSPLLRVHLLALLCSYIVSCSDNIGTIAGNDSESDSDTQTESHSDTDTDSDSDTNTGSDSDTDTGTDSDTDTDTDTLEDPDVDTSSVELWPGCPSKDAFVGDENWQWKANISNQAIYCAVKEEGSNSDPVKSLQEMYAVKAQLQFVPGTYSFPQPQIENASITMPFCYKALNSDDVFVPKTTGSMIHSTQSVYLWDLPSNTEFAANVEYFVLTQPTQNSQGDSMEFRVQMEYYDYSPTTPGTPSLTGIWSENYLDKLTPSFVRIREQTTPDSLYFYPCTFFDVATTPNIMTVAFEGGEINLDVDIFSNLPDSSGTEPYSFVQASGTYKNTEFDIQDYWQLIYAPEHHHFLRHFAVLFDEPIEDACGLMVLGIDPWITPLTSGVSVHTIDCDINSIDELTLTNVTKQ